jgi:hypothetical protein
MARRYAGSFFLADHLLGLNVRLIMNQYQLAIAGYGLNALRAIENL